MDPLIQPPELVLPAQIVSPAGLTCNTAYLREPIAEDFIVPAITSVAAVKVCNNLQYAVGCYIYIVGGGFFEVVGRPSIDTLMVLNRGHFGNAAATTVVPEGSDLILAGWLPANSWLALLGGYPGEFAQGGLESCVLTAGSIDENVANITFGAAFSAAPVPLVILTANPAVGGSLGGLFSLYASDVSLTGFKLYASNSFSVNQTILVAWIAIG
jgi:hypothetical protein